MKTRTKQLLAALAFAAAALAGAATAAHAAETLIYTGSAFTESNTNPLTSAQPVDPALGTSIVASFTIPVAVGYSGEVTTATDWSISTVGGFTVNPGNGTYELDLNLVNGLPGDGVGVVADWSFTGFASNGQQILSVGPPDAGAHDLAGPSKAGLYNLTFTSGTWALAGGVPEPSTWAMMLVGFGLIGWALRRKGRAAMAAA